jgi:hypothetical protein
VAEHAFHLLHWVRRLLWLVACLNPRPEQKVLSVNVSAPTARHRAAKVREEKILHIESPWLEREKVHPVRPLF